MFSGHPVYKKIFIRMILDTLYIKTYLPEYVLVILYIKTLESGYQYLFEHIGNWLINIEQYFDHGLRYKTLT